MNKFLMFISNYLPIIAFSIMAYSAFKLYRNRLLIPSILIGIPSSIIVILKGMSIIAYNEISKTIYGTDGEVVGATGKIDIWQQSLFWIYPVAIIIISIGLLLICKQQISKKGHCDL